MSKNLRSKILATIMMMLIVLVGGSLEVNAAVWETGAILMEREYVDNDEPTLNGHLIYMLGAYRAGKTTYTADLVDKIIFSTTVPTGYIADGVWDVSKNDGDYAVVSYLVPSTTRNGFYDQYLVTSDSKIFLENGYAFFAVYENMTSIENISMLDTSRTTVMSSMFYDCNSLKELDLSGFDTSNVTNMVSMFASCYELTTLNISGFNTSKVKNMGSMFFYCSKLTTLDVSNFDTSNVTDMGRMFTNCSSLIELDVSDFDTSNVDDMEIMFSSCSSLTKLDVSGFDTSNVKDMDGMFFGCRNLTELDVSDFDTSNVTDMSYMFSNCSNLTEINVSNFDTSNVTNMSDMFSSCSNLTEINVSNFDTSNVTDMNSMFFYCSSAKVITLGQNFDTSNVSTEEDEYGDTGTSDMFYGTSSLEKLIIHREATSTDDLKIISADTGLDSANLSILYVPSTASEELYESVDTTLGDARIEPIIKLAGNNPATAFVGTTYTDAGATIGGDTAEDTAEMEELGYTLETTSTVNTSTVGTKNVTYTLKYKGQTIATETRTVNVVTAPELMHRDGTTETLEIMLGAYRAGKTTYTADKVDRIIFSTTIPSGYVADAVWDVSETNGDYAVVSYLVASATRSGYYDQYIVANTTILAPTNSKALFNGYTNMTSIVNIAQLDTSNVTTMRTMFKDCSSLKKLDLISFNTSNVTEMYGMFYNCASLTQLTVSNFNTTNVSDMFCMFWGCSLLTSLDLTSFDTSNVIDMGSMFSHCNALTKLDISNFNTAKVTNMHAMFYECKALNELNISSFDTTNVTDMGKMFHECNSLDEITLTHFNTTNTTDMESMFYNCSSLTSLDLSSFNTGNVADMRWMFYGCSGLTSLNLGSNFDTSSLTSTYSMFNGCSSLPKLVLGNKFDTTNVTDMSYMFYNCSSLTSLNISMFDWSKAVTLNSMFAECTSLATISFPQKATTAAENTEAMFRNCSSLTMLDARIVNVAGVKNMVLMFEGCSSLTTLNLIGFNTQALDSSNSTFKWDDGTYCKGMDGLFNGCTNLETIILGVTFTRLDGKYMFDGCSSLRNIFAHREADVASGVMTGSTDNSLSSCASATLYVPNAVAEGFYEADSTYLSALTADRIEPMIDLIGDNPMKVTIGGTYTEPGAVVLGYDDADLSELESMGYSYAVTTPTISTSAEGTYEVTYTLSYAYSTNSHVTVATETRTVNVRELPKLMARETGYSGGTSANQFTYMLGAFRANKITYTSDLVERVIFSTTIPEEYIEDAVWDVSYTNGDNEVVSYLVASETTDGLYDQYIVADSTILAPQNGNYLFANYKNMTTIINVEQLSTSGVTNMCYMFCKAGYSATTFNLDISGWDTSSVTNMDYMFWYAGRSATTFNLDISGWDTSNVTSMRSLFSTAGYSATTWNIGDISDWDTSSVTDMALMFSYAGYSATTWSIGDISGWDTSNVTSMSSMFQLAGYSATTWNIGDISDWDTSNVTNMHSMFREAGYSATTWSIGDLSNWDTSRVTNMGYIFYNAGYKATTFNLNLSNWDTSRVTNMRCMLCRTGYSATTWSIGDLSGWDTSSVTDMYYMLSQAGYSATTWSIGNLSGWDTSNVTNMSSMFQFAGYSATTWSVGDLSNWNTSSVTDMSYMFYFAGYKSTTFNLDLSNWDTSSVTNMNNMFYSCRKLSTLVLGEKFTKVNGPGMFSGCSSLTRIISLYKPTSSGDIMEVSSDNYLGQLSTRVLYVPNITIEGYYEENETYMSLLGAERIQPIMSIAGSNPISVEGGSTYGEEEDEGVTVLKLGETNKANYNSLGFTTTTSGLAVNTNTPADKYVTYNLYYNGSLMDTQQRTVKIAGGNYLVGSNYYRTLKAAVDSITSTGTIYAMKDNTDTSYPVIPSSKNITLDLGNVTITKTRYSIKNEGTLTITGEGTLETTGTSKNVLTDLITNYGTLTIENGNLINKGHTANDFWIVVRNLDNSNMTINGGSLKTATDSGVSVVKTARTVYLQGDNIEFVMNDGSISNEGAYGTLIEKVIDNSTNSSIDINGGELTNSSGGGVEVSSSADATSISVSNAEIITNEYCIAVWDDSTYTGNIYVSNAILVSETGRAIRNPGTTNTLTIEGFTQIVAEAYSAIVSNTPNTIIGTSDDLLLSVPMIKSSNVALEAPNGFKFYDGILFGESVAHTGTITDKPSDCEVSYGEITVDGVTYQVAALGTYLMKRSYTIDDNGVASATHILGAEEAGYTQYTADKVESIAFLGLADMLANTYAEIPTWDVSDVQNGGIKARLFDDDDNGLYEMQIYSTGKIYLREDGLEMLFADYSNCTSITGLENLVIPQVTTMYGTFLNNTKLEGLDLSNIDTSEVVNFAYAFAGCEALSTLNINEFNTGSAITTKAMFKDCKLLEEIPVLDWRMTNVADMSSMFENCNSVKVLDVSQWNTSAAVNMSKMFSGCESVEVLDVVDWNVSKVENASGMFENCRALASLNLINFDFASLESSTGKDNMFANCTKLEMLALKDTFYGLNGTDMFKGCTSLVAIITVDPISNSSEAISLSTTTGLNDLANVVFYVPNPVSEQAYEGASNYTAVFTADRIKPLLELRGNDRVYFFVDGEYYEEGYKVANNNIETLTSKGIDGFEVEITGVDDIDFSTMGIYYVDYTLSYQNPNADSATTFMTLTREVQVGEITANIYITGRNEYDSTLTVEIDTTTIDESSYTYQWYVSDTNDTTAGTPISGATLSTYTIPQGMVGRYIYVELLGKKEGFEDVIISDITDEAMNLSATVMKKSLSKPTTPNNLTYNGVEQTYVEPVFVEKYMTVSGNKGKMAGTYTATFSLKMKDDCEWAGSSTDDVLVSWTISPKAIAVVWDEETELIYNGNEQAPEVYALTGVDGETAVLTRTMNINAGRHLSEATLTEINGGNVSVANYTLINNSYVYEILKATPTFTVTPSNLVLTDGNSGFLNYEASIESEITIVSANEEVAIGGTINSTNRTIEVVSTGSGSTVLTVTLNETDNYNSVSRTITVGSIEAIYTDGKNYYETLNVAFRDAEDNATITVLKDAAETSIATIESGKTITLNLNNRTIKTSVGNFITVKGILNIEYTGQIVTEAQINNLIYIDAGTLTINNGVQLEGYNTAVSNNAGTFNMNGGSLTQKNATSDQAVLYVSENATANISAGTVKSISAKSAIENEGTIKLEYINNFVEVLNSTKSNEVINNKGTFSINGAKLEGKVLNESGNMTLQNSTLSVESDGDDSTYEYALNVNAGEVVANSITMTGSRLLNVNGANAKVTLSSTTATTEDIAIITTAGELTIDKASTIKSPVNVLEISGIANILNSTIETTNTSDASNSNAIYVKNGGSVTVEDSNLIANIGKAIKNEGTLSVDSDSAISSLGSNTILNDGTLTIGNSTIENTKTDGGIALDNNGIATLNSAVITSNGNVIDNSGTISMTGSNITSASGTVMVTSGTANVYAGSTLTGANGIENTGTLTLGTADGNVLRETITVDAQGRAIKNDNVFNWYDGQIKGNASIIYLGNTPVVEDYVAIAIETEGTMETRYVVKDLEVPVIENLISETDWIKNSQTIQVIATDNVRIEGYAITESNEEPAIDSNTWTTGNTFSVTENKTYFIWVKDNAGNITCREFVAKWVCQEIWNTTGTTGSETRAILCLNGTLLFEVAARTKGTNLEATGVIKDYTISSAPWTNDARVKGITVSDGITKIGEYGLSNARTATFVSIPASVTSIAETAMYRTNNYGSLTVDGGNPNFIADENAIYNREKSIIYSYSPTNNSTTFTMPESVKTIVPGLFYENTQSQEIIVSKNLTRVGENAFEFVTGKVYYYTSSYEMHTYAQNNDTEANFIPIDNVDPIIESFVINDNDTAATSADVTLTIVVTDDIKVDSIYASETYYTDSEMEYLDASYWTKYSGTEYPFMLTSNQGTKYVYVWAKDTTGNISQVAEDYIYFGDVAFELYGQKDIVQYVDESGRDFYKYLEDIQGGSTQIDKITIDVVGSVDHRNVGTYPIVYSVTIDGTLMQSKTRTIDVIANTWNGATGTSADGFGYVIHPNGKYAKITSYTGSVGTTLTIPATITHNGASYKVIDVGNTSANTNILGNTSNTSVTTVVLPDTIINIAEYAFYGFAGLKNINIPSATMSISSNAFTNAGTTSGINLVLPTNFRELKSNALYGARISSMDFGNTIRHIAENAFAKVTVPSEFIMELPASLEAIGTAAFESTRIYDIKIDENNSKFKLDSSDMALLTADGETLVIYPIASPFEEYVSDEGVKTIGIKAFKEADTLKVINLPSTLTTISASAFESATDTHTITNIKLATTIGEYAFANTVLKETELHRSLAVIEKGTFENTKLEFIRIPSNVVYIKEDAFKGITALKSAVIESKPTMSSNAFVNCSNLEFIMISNQNGVAAIADTTAIPESTIIYVPSSMEVLYEGDSVYMGYSNYADKIKPILKLLGEPEVTVLVNNPYVEAGVELIEETFTTAGNSSKVDGLELVIEGVVDVTKSERTVINYIAKYKGTEVNRIIRTVDVEDYELPVINNVTTDSDWVSPKQTFVVEATDNIGITHYIITAENTTPSLDDSRWQTSSSLKVDTNGVWYIFVKDNAGNISERKQVTSTWVAAGKWDVSKNQDNTVHGVVTLDEKTLIIKGVGETKDYSENSTPWLANYADTITTITVESGVTSIGNNLLGYLPNVLTINLSSTVSKVVDGAFAYTNEFNAMNLNGNTNLVYTEGTLYNAAKTELYVHTNKYTTDYALPSSVTKICAAAFVNSIYVSNFDMTNVVEIQNYAFNNCIHMANQYIPKTLERIGKNVFASARGPIYYYSSCETMMNYVATYGSESNFVEIDDIAPVIKNLSINNNDAITDDANVTLQIEATDNIALSKIIIETTLSQNITSTDSHWTNYAGETELSYTLPNVNGISVVYVWVMDTSNNISSVATDSIVLGENDFSFEYNDTIVQYVDNTPENYYKFDEEVQGKYFVTTDGFTVTVDSNIDLTTVGEKKVVYKLSFEGTEAGEFYKIVDVIEDSWGTEVFAENGFSFVKHSSKNYAKIVKYTASNTVTFPSVVTNGGVNYKVIEIESLDSNPVVNTAVTSVTLPNTIISIGKNAFVGCTSLKNIDFKENVMTIEENAFKNSGLTTLDLKLNVREVKESAFENTKITSFNNSKLLKSVETKAFRNALNIAELVIPNDIYNIDECAFGGSIIDRLSFASEGDGSRYTIYNEIALIENSTNTLLQYVTGSSYGEIEITKNNIAKIGAGAFMNAENLTKLVIKSAYREIGEEAFRNTKLKVFEVPAEVGTIPAYAFADSTSLEVLLLNGATSITGNAFENTTALKSLGLLTSELCGIDDVSKLSTSTNVYVLNENKYDVSSYWSAIADRIYEFLRLNGDSYITTEAGFDYEELGVYAMDVLFKTSDTYAEIDNLSVEIIGTIDTSKLGQQEVTYKLKSKNSTKSEINRIVDVVDTIAPRIENINIVNEMQVAKERFTVIASDNHKITGYAITQDPSEPLITSGVWSDSNILHATVNGTWYIWVKDEAGNISKAEVEATNICTEKWDIGVVPNTVFAVLTSDNCLLIEGVGAVKYYDHDKLPWSNYFEAIRSVEIREGVTKLREYTLEKLVNATSISLPSTLVEVHTATFIFTNNFNEVVFPNGTDTFIYENGNLYSENREILYVHSNKDITTNYTIDESVKTIAEYAFANNANIVEVISNSNPSLYEGAFYNVSTLENISGDIGGSMIGAYAFAECGKLKGVELSSDIELIGGYAFNNCDMITSIEMIMCTNLKTFEDHAFANLHNLKEMKVYRSITRILSDSNGIRNVFENMGSNFAENARVYYYEGCTAMEDYAKNYADENVDFIIIDELGPRVEKLTVINQDSGMYATGTLLEIVAEMTEEFVTYKGTIPSLSIQFGDGRIIELGEGEVYGKQLYYTYTLDTEDLGVLTCVSFTGELYDALDNRTIFNSSETFDKEIIARTGVKLESDTEGIKYFTTLKAATDYITVGGLVTMLLDENTEETSIFKANTLVSLDINGKKVTFNNKLGGSLIVNRGVLNITDSGAGALTIVGNESGEVTAISNEGNLTIVNGIVRAQGSGDVTAYGIYNEEYAELIITGGSVEGINNTGMSYGVVNKAKLRMEGGNIQSSTVEGKTYALYNLGDANVINGQIAARISSGTKGETIAVYIENGTFVVGNGDETINPDNPIIYSTKDGLINEGGTLEFYDGFIEGQAYRSLSTDNVKVVPGFALIRKLIGNREKAMLDYDIVKPTIKLTNLTPDWTNGSVTIEAHFIDEESGILSAEHNNQKLELVNNKATIETFENGTFTFKATDFAGNVTEESIEIKNIDRQAPTFENVSYVALANDEEVTFRVTLKDDASGVYGYSLSKFDAEPSKWTKLEKVLTESTVTTAITSNGKYFLYAIDDAGNVSQYGHEINITNVDANIPKITSLEIEDDGRGFANSSTVMIKIEAEDDTGVSDILLSNSMLTNNEVMDSEDWVPYTEDVIWNLTIGDGEKIVYAWVRDRVGRISRSSTVSTKLLAQYIGNNGTNKTSYKMLIKDANYNFGTELTNSDVSIKVKSGNTTSYTGSAGKGVTLTKAPIVYGPILENSIAMSGRYYFLETNNIEGNGIVYICLNSTAETDKAGNQIPSNQIEVATDVTVELEAPIITIGNTQISVYDADNHVMNVLRIDGKTVKLKNGVITKAELQSTYGMTLTTDTVLEAFDKCGNITKQTSSVSWGGSSTGGANTFTFTYHGMSTVKYTAEAGMTWGEWVTSSYAQGAGFYVDASGIVRSPEGELLTTTAAELSSNDYLVSSDVIYKSMDGLFAGLI